MFEGDEGNKLPSPRKPSGRGESGSGAEPRLTIQQKSTSLDEGNEDDLDRPSKEDEVSREQSKFLKSRGDHRRYSLPLGQQKSATALSVLPPSLSPRVGTGDVIFVERPPAFATSITNSERPGQAGLSFGGTWSDGAGVRSAAAQIERNGLQSRMKHAHSAAGQREADAYRFNLLDSRSEHARATAKRGMSPSRPSRKAAAWTQPFEAAIDRYKPKLRTVHSTREGISVVVNNDRSNVLAVRSGFADLASNQGMPPGRKHRIALPEQLQNSFAERENSDKMIDREVLKQPKYEIEEQDNFADGKQQRNSHKVSEYLESPAAAALSAALSGILSKKQRDRGDSNLNARAKVRSTAFDSHHNTTPD